VGKAVSKAHEYYQLKGWFSLEFSGVSGYNDTKINQGRTAMKKLTGLFLSLVLTLSLSTVAFAADLSFSDVPSSDWAYPTIMRATELGLFKGTSTVDANGVGTFSPDRTMSRAEFITVCVRALEADATDYKGSEDGLKDSWYDGYWDQAVRMGIIPSNAFGGLANFGQAMSREEMAYAAINTLSVKGEEATDLLAWNRIPDMNSVNVIYQPYVLRAYSMGILCGTDNKGTFSPNDTLTRAQAATVLVRLLDAESRQTVSKEAPVSTDVQTWVEGQTHGKPKAGDIVTNSKGEKITLTETKIGNYTILGVGQPVDIWTGYKNYHVGGDAGWGEFNTGDSSRLHKSSITGEVHTQEEWQLISNLYSMPITQGSYDGEIANTYYRWTVQELDDFNASLIGTKTIENWKPCFGDIKK